MIGLHDSIGNNYLDWMTSNSVVTADARYLYGMCGRRLVTVCFLNTL